MAADVSAKYIHQDKGEDYPLDVDSIFFTYDPLAAQATAPPYAQPPSYGLLPQGQPAPPFVPAPYAPATYAPAPYAPAPYPSAPYAPAPSTEPPPFAPPAYGMYPSLQ